ncbi:zinc finger-containing ubiquitin peptidase 1 isoform X2 [Pseudophryne corroboree]
MKSHLLLTHMEQDNYCPFCTIAGLAYDELHHHIQSAHADTLEAWSSDEEHPEEMNKPPTSFFSSSNNTVTEKSYPGNHMKLYPNEIRLPLNIGLDNNKIQSSLKAEDVTSNAPSSSGLTCKADASCSPLTTNESALRSTIFDQELLNQCHSQSIVSTPNATSSGDTVLGCPFCLDVKSSIEEIEFHVRTEHEDLLDSPSKGNTSQEYECPICSMLCANEHLLQEHVNLHLEESYCDEAKISNDLILARQLQAEEYKRQRADESKKEMEEFRKLQRQFGLDNSGGYRQQSMQNLEKAVARGRVQPMEFHRHKVQMMESLATGVDDGRTRTSGVVEALHHYYNIAAPEVCRVWLCSPLDHYSNSAGDRGWGCGFRNFQMLLSSILMSDSYRHCLQECGHIPCIPKIQSLIEDAWKEGFDPQGASHFSGKLQGTKAWIGASEIYCLLTSLKIKCRILDFHKPSSTSGTHPLLFEWVLNYYAPDASETGGKVWCSSKPAIYLQHQGHSRTIVGIEERKNKSYCLLIFDPGCPSEAMQRLTKCNIDSAALKHLRKYVGSLKHKQYQIVAADGVLLPEEKAARLQMSKVFRAERIP